MSSFKVFFSCTLVIGFVTLISLYCLNSWAIHRSMISLFILASVVEYDKKNSGRLLLLGIVHS